MISPTFLGQKFPSLALCFVLLPVASSTTLFPQNMSHSESDTNVGAGKNQNNVYAGAWGNYDSSPSSAAKGGSSKSPSRSSRPIVSRPYTCSYYSSWRSYNGFMVPAVTTKDADGVYWSSETSSNEMKKSDGKVQMLRSCTAKPGQTPDSMPEPELVWVSEGDVAGSSFRVVSAEDLAADAFASAQLPAPVIAGTSPDPESDRPPLVNMPLWWWVDRPAPVTARAEAGGVWAEVTATPVSTTWTTSGGDVTKCSGFGIPWSKGLSERNTSACTVTYVKTSDPENATVGLVWDVSWTSNVQPGGSLGTATSESTWSGRIWQRQVLIVPNKDS